VSGISIKSLKWGTSKGMQSIHGEGRRMRSVLSERDIDQKSEMGDIEGDAVYAWGKVIG